MLMRTKFLLLLGLTTLCTFGCSREQAINTARHSGSQAMPLPATDAAYAPNMPAEAEEVEHNTERYDHIVENPFLTASEHPLSTFAVDVDTASYANVRRMLNANRLPPAGAVRVEEMINYFRYDYPQPVEGKPFSVNVEVAQSPWAEDHQLVRIGLQGQKIETENRPLSNLVFLLDVSGSMHNGDKLPLVKAAMKLLVEQLGENDRVSIVVYAGASGVVLPSTTADNKLQILDSLEQLAAGGSTNGGEGIQLAYQIAEANLIPGGVNRVLLCTDGDFNVGTTSQSSLIDLIEEKARSGVFLSVLGVGTGNYNDSTMEKLADKGNGNYAYIDSIREAQKVLVEQISGTLVTIAKDVKIQVDFNPAKVQSYRLIGYENRMLQNEDFLDDAKDAGEIGAGHTVTALYEIVPVGITPEGGDVEPSKYQQAPELTSVANSNELLTVRLRYKEPEGNESQPMNLTVLEQKQNFTEASLDFRFATAVAAFGMSLRDSKYKGSATLEEILQIAEAAVGDDSHGYRAEFLQLVHTANVLKAGN